MNYDHILELADKAEDFADTVVDAGGEFHTTYTKKFAELIVKECIICAEREWIRNGDTEHNRAVSKVIESIKEHFGVE